MKKSAVYNYKGKKFRYDYENCLVERVYKADKEMLADNEEWIAKYGKPLFDIDEKGYEVIAAVGLSVENWRNKEVRNEYLDGWIWEMNEEVRYEMEIFEMEMALGMVI